MPKAITASILLCCTIFFAKGQGKTDSLKQALTYAENDSIKTEILLQLSQNADDPKEGIDYGLKALTLAEKSELLLLAGEITNSLGIWYYEIGDYEKTLDYFYQGQEIHETLKDTSALARSYNNIGLILSDLGRIKETIKYHKLSLEIKRSLNDQLGMANSYSNLGLAYEKLDSLDVALNYYRIALKIDKANNDAYGLFTIYNNIGKNYFKRKQYDSTVFYYNKAVTYSAQVDNKYNKAEFLRDYAALNAARNEYGRAIEKYNSSLLLANEAEAKSIIRDNYLGLSQVYESQSEIEKAFDYYQKYDSVNEVIFSEEQNLRLADIERNYQIQKGQREIELLRKETEIKDLRIRNNTYAMYFLIAAILLVATIVILQYRKNLYKTRTNKLLRSQNDEIAYKNKNIMDSIIYAKNIQKAILPSGQKLQQLFEDAFVFSKARDIVNGDFYWFAEKGDKVVVAAVDCTGHGVPAAFLNVLGNSHLNNIVIENDVLEPGIILEQLNQRMVTSMHGNKLGLHTDDGMDIGMCLFDKSTYQLLFAGAKRPLYYFNHSELKVVKGDSHPVGGDAYGENRAFIQHSVQLNRNDCLYMFTDGLVDQFGGKKNKKFMYPRLRDLLRRIYDQPMEDQLMILKDDLMTWKGDREQTDDILIIGIRV